MQDDKSTNVSVAQVNKYKQYKVFLNVKQEIYITAYFVRVEDEGKWVSVSFLDLDRSVIAYFINPIGYSLVID